MNLRDATKAADSLMEHLRLSDAQAAVLVDRTAATEATLRLYVFDPVVFSSRKWPKSWQGFIVQVVRSAPFRPHTRIAR